MYLRTPRPLFPKAKVLAGLLVLLWYGSSAKAQTNAQTNAQTSAQAEAQPNGQISGQLTVQPNAQPDAQAHPEAHAKPRADATTPAEIPASIGSALSGQSPNAPQLDTAGADSAEQKAPGRAIQLSGLVLDGTTDRPIPYADVYLPETYRGTAADTRGFFSLVVFTGDTVRVTAVGFKPWQSVLPDTVSGHLVSILIRLQADTIRLAPANVYPWPDRGDFRRALLATDVHAPEDDIAPYAGFRRIDNPRVPKATPMSPASFFYERVVRKIQKSKRKRRKAKKLPKMP
jgi:hypothetical protein